MDTLREKTFRGFSWNLVEGILSQGVNFIVGLLLSRILSPEDFGLIGLTTVIIAVCNSIINSGFSNALVRKLDVTDADYNTVFYINIGVSIVLCIILFFTSSFIAAFLNEVKLEKIINYSSLILILGSFSIVQRAILIKKLNFKTQAISSIISSIISGIIALYLAYVGYEVWSLVAMVLIRQFIYSLSLWFYTSWYPSLIFSSKSFHELFGYSYKLLLSELINTFYSNVYYFVIGKVYSAVSLGYYTRADGFYKPFSSNIALGIKRISFPVLSLYQDDQVILKQKFIRFIRLNMLISSLVMFFLIAAAKPMVYVFVGEKWHNSVLFMQLLSVTGLLYGLQILNLNLLMVKGYSNLSLKLEIIKKIFLIPIIVISSFFEIYVLLYAFVAFSFIEFLINSYYTNKILKYSLSNQVKDVFVFVMIGFGGCLLIMSVLLLNVSITLQLFFQVLIYTFYYFCFFIFSPIKEFQEIKQMIMKIKFKK